MRQDRNARDGAMERASVLELFDEGVLTCSTN